MSMTADAGLNASVASGGGQVSPSYGATAAPGATAPLGQMGVDKAVIVTIGVAAGALLAMRVLFGEKKTPPVQVSAMSALNVYFSWLLINGAVKIVAYKYHGHKAAQAYLLVA